MLYCFQIQNAEDFQELQQYMDSSDDGFRDLLDYAGCSVYSLTKLEQKDVIVHDFLHYSLIDKLEKPIQQYAIIICF